MKNDRFVVDRSILMYGVAGEKATGRCQIGRFYPDFADPNIVHAPCFPMHICVTYNLVSARRTKCESVWKSRWPDVGSLLPLQRPLLRKVVDAHSREYTEYPKIGNYPTLQMCMVLHMDSREYGSFLFSDFPCITEFWSHRILLFTLPQSHVYTGKIRK